MSKKVLQELMNNSKARNKKSIDKIAVDSVSEQLGGWL